MYRHLHADAWPRTGRPRNLYEFWRQSSPLTENDYNAVLQQDVNLETDSDSGSNILRWRRREELNRRALDHKWQNLTAPEKDENSTKFALIKQQALQDNIAAEVSRTGQTPEDILPSRYRSFHGSKDPCVLHDLPRDILSRIFSCMEVYDVTICGRVCTNWRAASRAYLATVQEFSYSLSFHVLRHTHWLELGGDFTANRMLYHWTTVGMRVLSFVRDICIGLKKLTIDFPAEDEVVRSIIASCTNLDSIVLETRGHTSPADYVGNCSKLESIALSFTSDLYALTEVRHPIPFISGQGIHNLVSNNCALRVVSLTSDVGIESIEGDDIRFILEECPHLEAFELVGIDKIGIDEIVPSVPLSLRYFNLWRSDDDDTVDMSGHLIDFLDQCPRLQLLSYGHCFSTVSTPFELENLVSKFQQLPLEAIFLSFYKGQEPLLVKLCDDIGANVKIVVVWDFSNRSPSRMHHTWSIGKYAFPLGTGVPTQGHPALAKIIGNSSTGR